MKETRFLVAACAAVLVTACAGSAGRRPAVSSATPDYVTGIEIEATPASNAYDLINRLRPRWLQQPRTASISGGRVRSAAVAVYLDGVRIGSLDALRSMSTAGFKSMRYYDAARAAAVLRDPGPEPLAGAIVITTSDAR